MEQQYNTSHLLFSLETPTPTPTTRTRTKTKTRTGSMTATTRATAATEPNDKMNTDNNRGNDNNSKNSIYRHVAHPLAASWINRNTQDDRDNSNHANHKAPTRARTAPANSTNKRARRTHRFFPPHSKTIKDPGVCRVKRDEECAETSENPQLEGQDVLSSAHPVSEDPTIFQRRRKKLLDTGPPLKQ